MHETDYTWTDTNKNFMEVKIGLRIDNTDGNIVVISQYNFLSTHVFVCVCVCVHKCVHKVKHRLK